MWPIVEHREKVVCRPGWGELEQPLAELAALDDFGFECDGAVRRREDEALADGDFAAGTDKGAPAIMADGFSQHDFDAAGRFFAFPD